MSENIPTTNPDRVEAIHRQAKIDGTMLYQHALETLVPVVPDLKNKPHVALALAHALAYQTFSVVKDCGMDPADLDVGANYTMRAFGQFLSELYHEAIAAGTKGDTIVAQTRDDGTQTPAT